jgi:glycerol-3-phosphate acyltransferase PlsX
MAGIPRIGIDAMGGDLGPTAVAAGTVTAFREMPGRFTVTLVGDQEAIRPALQRAGGTGLPIEIVHAAGQVEMGEKATAAARRRNTTSMGVAIQLHKEGKLDAVFSAGNTGAVVATALMGLGRLESVSRPALAVFMPNTAGGTVLLDVGANAECRPSYLVQFAHMGAVYARYRLGRENPRVGPLSIGEEETKGNPLVFEAGDLLRRARHLNFIGHVEGRDLFRGTCDVIVTDGFTGNVLLKTAEGVAAMLVSIMKEDIGKDPLALAGMLLMRPAMMRMKHHLDWEEHGAAPLLGINGVCFIGHGSSGPRAFKSAIRTVTAFVEKRVNEHIREEIEADHDSAA